MTHTCDTDRRRFTRVDFKTSAKIIQGQDTFDTKLLDISINGLLVQTPTHYKLRSDKDTFITIHLSGDAVIHMTAALVHSSTDSLGFRCESIDMESMAHLRRLLELNINDPGAPERVLTELLAHD